MSVSLGLIEYYLFMRFWPTHLISWNLSLVFLFVKGRRKRNISLVLPTKQVFLKNESNEIVIKMNKPGL